MHPTIRKITKEQEKEGRDHFKVGDEVLVHTRVREGEKERIQVFKGIVISRKGTGLQETFIVHRHISGSSVERLFPVHSPNIDKIEVVRKSKTLRARMYYLRDWIGKRANKVKEVK